METEASTSSTTQAQSFVPTELIRERIRKFFKQHRSDLRASDADYMRFGLGEIQQSIEKLENVGVKDVSGLAVRIKRRKRASVADMFRLSHAFLQDIENIECFANTPGAMQVLVKELTGYDAECQGSACECLCNMSLGGAFVCEKIANMAGSYLVIFLDNTEERLKRTSLWTLTNILHSGGKAAQTLIQMELMRKLWSLYIDDNVTDASTDYRNDAGICLRIISQQAAQILRKRDVHFIRQNFHNKNRSSVAGEYHLEILFNCQIASSEVYMSEMQMTYLINYAISNINRVSDLAALTDRIRVLYAVRILGNLAGTQPEMLETLLKQLLEWETELFNIFNKLFDYRVAELTRETLWLLQNVLRQEDKGIGDSTKNNLLNKLIIYHADVGIPNIVDDSELIAKQ